MTTATARNVDAYYVACKELVESVRGRQPEWLIQQRQQAAEYFLENGFPVDDEEWRLTNLSLLTKRTYQPATQDSVPAWDEISALLAPGLTGPRIVVVDGKFSAELSDLANLPANVEVSSLNDALASQSDFLANHLGRYADIEQQAFNSLNTALWSDGAYIRIGKNVTLDSPIQLIYVSTAQDGALSNPRTLVLADPHSHVNIIEYHVGLGEAEYFSNGVTEVVVEQNAFLGHYWIELESLRAVNVSTLRAQLHRDSRLESHTVLLGGALVRNNIHPVLNGENGDCLINGVYVGNDRQHLDNHMRIEHAKAHCSSRQFYRGILDDHATGVFTGRIVVHPDAQKTDAKQSNMNLLLSENAEADSKPQLEIYADDVKCTHGATIGQLDEDAIFYLRARGIDNQSARNMLIHAFAAESLDRIPLPTVREYLAEQLDRRLP